MTIQADKMGYRSQLLSLFILPILILPSTIHAKSTIEPCGSSDSCYSLLSYLLPWDSKISEIAYRFKVNVTDILASNAIKPTIPFPENQILKAKSLVKLPISCSCVDGIRRYVSVTHTVKPADTLDSISADYGRLVSAEQITSTNNSDRGNPSTSGQSLVIPLPCTCFNNSNNGITSVYMSYVVQAGQNLSGLGAKFGATVQNLVAINELGKPAISPGDILAIPIPACSSANLDLHNESLIVPNGSYALTANKCIKCICGPIDLNLRCLPSGVPTKCSHLQCKGSNLTIGDKYMQRTSNVTCDIVACVYRGHNGHIIHNRLANFSQVQCPVNQSNKGSPLACPSPESSIVPFVTLSPSPSPLPTSNHSMMVNGLNPARRQDSKNPSSSNPRGLILSYLLVLLEFVAFLCLVY